MICRSRRDRDVESDLEVTVDKFLSRSDNILSHAGCQWRRALSSLGVSIRRDGFQYEVCRHLGVSRKRDGVVYRGIPGAANLDELPAGWQSEHDKASVGIGHG